jgi:hypothetical protein
MAVQPQFHDGFSFESKPKEMIHAHSDSTREMVTCAQLLPSVFATRNDVGRKFPIYDEHQVDCGDCDIPTVVSLPSSINALADKLGPPIYRLQYHLLGRAQK